MQQLNCGESNINDHIWKSLWAPDLAMCVALGALIGYRMAVESSDGEVVQIERIVLMTMVGGLSYALAWPAVLRVKRASGRLPGWLCLGIGGSVIFSFINQLIFVFMNGPIKEPEFLATFAARNFIVGVVFFSVIILTFLIIGRITAFLIKRFLIFVS